MTMNWMRAITAALLVLGVNARFRSRTRCNGSNRRDRELVESYFAPFLQPGAHRQLHFGVDGPLCTDPEAIQTCYIFLYDPDRCDKNDACSNLCDGICSEYLDDANGCLVEPCMGLGCNLAQQPPTVPAGDDGSCAAIVNCFNDENDPGCNVDICATYPNSKACAYINQNGWDSSGDYEYIVPCPCTLPGGYDPATRDAGWPGTYPGTVGTTSGATVTINVRTDEFPSEIFWLLRKLNGADWDFVSGGTFSYNVANKLVSNRVEVEPGSVYELIFTDTYGDGFYTDAYGLGWFSVVQGVDPNDDNCKNDWQTTTSCGVLYTKLGEYEGQTQVYFQVDAGGTVVALPDYTPSDDNFGAEPPESCFEPGCFVASRDAENHPGPGPDLGTGYVSVNVRTDLYPFETAIYLYELDASTFDWIQAGSVEYTLADFQTLYSFDFPVSNDKIYKVVIVDDFGDGICCAVGYGWATIVDSVGLVEDISGEFGLNATRFIYVDASGAVQSAEYIPDRGYAAVTIVVPELNPMKEAAIVATSPGDKPYYPDLVPLNPGTVVKVDVENRRRKL